VSPEEMLAAMLGVDASENYVSEVERRLDSPPRSASAPQYDYIGSPTYLLLVQQCRDCGALIHCSSEPDHDRFHAILNDHARALAVLVTSHLGELPHSKYDVQDRIYVKENSE
jgi:hypothetical protein